MKKHIFLFLIAAIFSLGAAATAFGQETTPAAAEETVTLQDLGVSDPGTLPTNPFYFLKEWGRGLRSLMTFNPVAKAELELKHANEKAAELKEVSETQSQNEEAVQKALENYQSGQEKLRERLKKLTETSQNPKVDALLDNLTDKVVKHEKLLDEITSKFKNRENISEAVQNAMSESQNIVGEASKKDDPAKFSARLEKVLIDEKGGELKHARSVEIIDRLEEKTTDRTKESLNRLREEFSDRLEADIENLLEEDGEDAVNQALSNTPGDIAKRAAIIEEIQKRAEERLSQTLEKKLADIETDIEKEANASEKAKEQIKKAEEMIREAGKKIFLSTSTEAASTTPSALLTEAKDHLAKAKTAFESKKYGEAFGQARSAEVLARNALKFFEDKEEPETESYQQRLKELEEKISKYRNLLQKRGYTEENNKSAYELINNAVLHLGYAKESFGKGDLASAKLHIGHVKEFLSKLSRIIEGKPEISTRAEQIKKVENTLPASSAARVAANCGEIEKRIIELKKLLLEDEVNESDFKEKYDNYLRELILCQQKKNLQPVAPKPAAEQSFCTLEYDPVCGSNGKTYSNTCLAKTAGITILYRGKCKLETETESEETETESVKPAEQLSASSVVKEIKLEADDNGFYPDPAIRVAKGAKVKIIFAVRSTNVYYGGLDIRSDVFETGTIKPGASGDAEFTASESFEFTSWWPLADVKKATGKVIVE